MKEVVLALLHGDGAHGYEVKQTLDGTFGEVLPAMNAGQIYTTLARLTRDELVTTEPVDGDARGKRVYRLTAAGQALLAEWVARPVPGMRLKSEFLMKLVAVATARLADPGRLIDDQRHEYLQSLRDLDGLLQSGRPGSTARLLVEGSILHVRADLEWLDLIESRLLAEGKIA
ncbi:MAG TPA: PadR family transcriptional regulator [Micromonosporaceae bacterium]|jgi:DNA-binding PadR family transcriptional regulator|nr:PadR family transcriptional regulator [Micromonosporaceae bacterium]